MADLVHGEVDGNELDQAEEEEGDEVLRVGAGVGDAVGDVGVGRPDGDEEEVQALSTNPRLQSCLRMSLILKNNMTMM